MKKRLSRSLALLLAVLALAGLLTACEDRRASPPPDATSPPSSDPEPQPQPDPQPEPEPEPEPECEQLRVQLEKAKAALEEIGRIATSWQEM